MKHSLEESALRSAVLRQQCRAEKNLRATVAKQAQRAADRRMESARTERLVRAAPAPVPHKNPNQGSAATMSPRATLEMMLASDPNFGRFPAQ